MLVVCHSHVKRISHVNYLTEIKKYIARAEVTIVDS